MSSAASKLFNRSTILQYNTVFINDYELSLEDVVSLEIKYDYFSFIVTGTMIFKDSVEISELDIWDAKTRIMVYGQDIYDEFFTRFFRVTNVQQELYNERFKAYNIEFMDTFSYEIKNTYISKSFNSSKSAAFQKYFDEFKWDDMISDDSPQLKKTFEDTGDVEPFIVPADRNILEYFEYAFSLKGYRLYQGRNVMRLTNEDFGSKEKLSETYTDNTENDIYGFKIHDYSLTFNPINISNTVKPKDKILKFDYNKIEDYETDLLEDVYDSIKMNKKSMSSLQHTTGLKLRTQELLGKELHKYELEEAYLDNNTLEIVVPGNFKYNEIGKLVDVDFKGNPLLTDLSKKGNKFNSGVYFVSRVTDRFVGNKLIQRLTLNRIDFDNI